VSNGPCEKCGKRPHAWFTDEGYLCGPCRDDLNRRQREQAHADLIESMRKALMEAHAEDWDMDSISEAAHICAGVVYP
jgi:hypothetical protein